MPSLNFLLTQTEYYLCVNSAFTQYFPGALSETSTDSPSLQTTNLPTHPAPETSRHLLAMDMSKGY